MNKLIEWLKTDFTIEEIIDIAENISVIEMLHGKKINNVTIWDCSDLPPLYDDFKEDIWEIVKSFDLDPSLYPTLKSDKDIEEAIKGFKSLLFIDAINKGAQMKLKEGKCLYDNDIKQILKHVKDCKAIITSLASRESFDIECHLLSIINIINSRYEEEKNND